MQCFVDGNDVTWEISLNVGLIDEIKGKLGIDLLEPVSEETSLVVELSPVDPANILKFTKLMYCLCGEQCEKSEMTESAFLRLFNSTTLKAAYDGFFQEWQDFFLSLGREDLTEAIVKLLKILQVEIAGVKAKIHDATFPSDNSPTSLPESSA